MFPVSLVSIRSLTLCAYKSPAATTLVLRVVQEKFFIRYAHVMHLWGAIPKRKKVRPMHLTHKIKEMAATGYILLWLLGIPVPILLLIFLLRGCT